MFLHFHSSTLFVFVFVCDRHGESVSSLRLLSWISAWAACDPLRSFPSEHIRGHFDPLYHSCFLAAKACSFLCYSILLRILRNAFLLPLSVLATFCYVSLLLRCSSNYAISSVTQVGCVNVSPLPVLMWCTQCLHYDGRFCMFLSLRILD